MSDSFKGQMLCSLAMVLVGSTVVISKVIGQDIEPFFATALRHVAALPVFLSACSLGESIQIGQWVGLGFVLVAMLLAV